MGSHQPRHQHTPLNSHTHCRFLAVVASPAMQVRAADGKKMSKSLKNYPDPNIVLREEGADSLRLYLITSPAVGAAIFAAMTCLALPVFAIAPTVTLTQRPDLAHPPPLSFRSQLLSRTYLRCVYMHAGTHGCPSYTHACLCGRACMHPRATGAGRGPQL